MNREQLLKKRTVTEQEFVNTVAYEFWMFRNYPVVIRERKERAVLELYLQFLKQGDLVLQK